MTTRRVSAWLPGYRDEISKRQCEVALTLKSVYRIEIAKHSRTWKADDERPMPLWCGELDLLQTREADDDHSSEEAGEVAFARRTKKRKHPDQLWLDLAKRLITLKIEPYSFIRMQFYAAGMSGGKPGTAPAPNSLNTAEAVRKYQEGMKSRLAEIGTGWTFQMAEFERHVACSPYSGEDAWAAILFSSSVKLSSLFRYCMAFDIAAKTEDPDKRERFARVCREHRADAAEQYLESPKSYDDVWGTDKIPTKLRKQAGHIYRARYDRKAI